MRFPCTYGRLNDEFLDIVTTIRYSNDLINTLNQTLKMTFSKKMKTIDLNIYIFMSADISVNSSNYFYHPNKKLKAAGSIPQLLKYFFYANTTPAPSRHHILLMTFG